MLCCSVFSRYDGDASNANSSGAANSASNCVDVEIDLQLLCKYFIDADASWSTRQTPVPRQTFRRCCPSLDLSPQPRSSPTQQPAEYDTGSHSHSLRFRRQETSTTSSSTLSDDHRVLLRPFHGLSTFQLVQPRRP